MAKQTNAAQPAPSNDPEAAKVEIITGRQPGEEPEAAKAAILTAENPGVPSVWVHFDQKDFPLGYSSLDRGEPVSTLPGGCVLLTPAKALQVDADFTGATVVSEAEAKRLNDAALQRKADAEDAERKKADENRRRMADALMGGGARTP